MKLQRPATRSVSELAREFGVVPKTIYNALARDKNSPQPVMRKGDRSDNDFRLGVMNRQPTKKSYYNHSEMRVWWQSLHKESKDEHQQTEHEG